jgi:hypothetical protein
MRCELDHLVVACADLEQGAAWVEEHLGVAVQPGGRHPTMGTHNRLLRLGARQYLELLAVDPETAPRTSARWYDLDHPAVQERARLAPFLLTWVARCDNIFAAVAQVPAVGEVQTFQRDALSWKLTVPDDGALQFGGVLPSLIQWDGDAHPCDQLADRRCELRSLDLSHPAAFSVLPLYRALRITGPIDLGNGPRGLSANIATPRGIARLT